MTPECPTCGHPDHAPAKCGGACWLSYPFDCACGGGEG